MNLILSLSQFNLNNVHFGEKQKNTVIWNSYFIKLIYSTQEISLNGIFLLINLKEKQIGRDYNKYKIKFNVARKKGWNKNPGSLEMLLGVCYIEIEDFTNARIELNKAIDLGKEKEANPWLAFIDSTESLRSAALR